jgi:hypothetical protein
MSSMRTTNLPPFALAIHHDASATTAPPRCKSPVGDGANRVTIFFEFILRDLL